MARPSRLDTLVWQMNIVLPNWFLCLGALGFVIWIFVGIQAYKAFRAMRYRAEMASAPPLPPHQSAADDADWWKREN